MSAVVRAAVAAKTTATAIRLPMRPVGWRSKKGGGWIVTYAMRVAPIRREDSTTSTTNDPSHIVLLCRGQDKIQEMLAFSKKCTTFLRAQGVEEDVSRHRLHLPHRQHGQDVLRFYYCYYYCHCHYYHYYYDYHYYCDHCYYYYYVYMHEPMRRLPSILVSELMGSRLLNGLPLSITIIRIPLTAEQAS